MQNSEFLAICFFSIFTLLSCRSLALEAGYEESYLNDSGTVEPFFFGNPVVGISLYTKGFISFGADIDFGALKFPKKDAKLWDNSRVGKASFNAFYNFRHNFEFDNSQIYVALGMVGGIKRTLLYFGPSARIGYTYSFRRFNNPELSEYLAPYFKIELDSGSVFPVFSNLGTSDKTFNLPTLRVMFGLGRFNK